MHDLLCFGRAAVDLYSEQIGASLAESQSFAKYVGGSPANIAIGAARQGLQVALLSRVGDDPLGCYVRDTLAGEQVDVAAVSRDPERRTGLAIVAVRGREDFDLVFYRDNCADMAVDPSLIPEGWTARTRCLVLSGTHLSTPTTLATSRRLLQDAQDAGIPVALDLDFRPSLWRESDVRSVYGEILPSCDLVVGTVAEFEAASGRAGASDAMTSLREQSGAVCVMKLGAQGCRVVDADEDFHAPGQRTKVMNVLGAGDAFMAGFLRRWLDGDALSDCATWANATAALVVSRHGCAPEMPSQEEVREVLRRGGTPLRPLRDRTLVGLHRSATAQPLASELWILAIDNRLLLEEICFDLDVQPARLEELKRELTRAGLETHESIADSRVGIILDDRWGEDALFDATRSDLWLARAIEESGRLPLAFEHGPNVGLTLRGWPARQCAKVLLKHHQDLPELTKSAQLQALETLAGACAETGRELLVEIIDPGNDSSDVARSMQQIYARRVRPQWWKVAAQPTAESWTPILDSIAANDPGRAGILILGGGRSEAQLAASFAFAPRECRGFAVGRTIFLEPSVAWLRQEIDSATLVSEVRGRFERVINLWRNRGGG